MDELLTTAERQAIQQSDHDCDCAVCDDLVGRYEATLAAREQAHVHDGPVLTAADHWADTDWDTDEGQEACEYLHAAVRAWRAAREG